MPPDLYSPPCLHPERRNSTLLLRMPMRGWLPSPPLSDLPPPVLENLDLETEVKERVWIRKGTKMTMTMTKTMR